jgi:6-phosphogluconolactonase (cycloisomerase 2 family)
MKSILHVLAGAGLVAGLSAAAPVIAGATGPHPAAGNPSNVVFAQNNDPSGNAIVAYSRTATSGTLALEAVYPTGGNGGVLKGSHSDHLGSQGSLAYDTANNLLYALNAGSNTISVFAVAGDHLFLRQVLSSGGTFPSSVAVHGDIVYVLNALGGGNVSGYRVAGGRLHPIAGSARPLGLTPTTGTSQFTHVPGQVAFSPDGHQLLVTTKLASTSIDVFAVGPDGRLSQAPVVDHETGTVPFAVTFDSSGRLLVVEAGTSALAEFTLNPTGTITPVTSAPTTGVASCWVAFAQGTYFVSNTASADVSGVKEGGTGTLSFVGTTGTDTGPVDAAASAGGQYLYVQTGINGILDEFKVTSNGALSPIGSIPVPNGSGDQGIVAF